MFPVTRPVAWFGVGGLVAIAVIALVLGVVVYLTARVPGSVYFLPADWNLELPWPPAVLAVAGRLPAFFHTLGFCLILALLWGGTHRRAALVCSGWFGIEAAFEIGQHPQLSPWLVEHLPHWFERVWLLDRTGDFFRAGSFDVFDLIAAGLGAVLAYVLIVFNLHGGGRAYAER